MCNFYLQVSLLPNHPPPWDSQAAEGRAGLAALMGMCCQHVVVQQIILEENGGIWELEETLS